MEKHNTHILLESISSGRHEYKGDENGNIKIDLNDDAVYHSFIQKKAKSSIKQILLENNNFIKQEFDENMDNEEIQKKENNLTENKKYTKLKKIKQLKTESDEKIENEKNNEENNKIKQEENNNNIDIVKKEESIEIKNEKNSEIDKSEENNKQTEYKFDIKNEN